MTGSTRLVGFVGEMRRRGTRRDASLSATGAGVQDTEVGAFVAVVGTDRLAAQTLIVASVKGRGDRSYILGYIFNDILLILQRRVNCSMKNICFLD